MKKVLLQKKTTLDSICKNKNVKQFVVVVIFNDAGETSYRISIGSVCLLLHHSGPGGQDFCEKTIQKYKKYTITKYNNTRIPFWGRFAKENN